jgi:hypothetical protein
LGRLTQLIDLWAVESAIGYRTCGLALLAVFGTVVALLVIQGAPPIGGPWVAMALLDGAWRIICGQVPHTDFQNPIGALTYALISFGMLVSAPSASAITYGIALFLVVIVPWAWKLASARLPAAVAFVFVLFLGFLLVAPRAVGQPIHDTTYTMLYNREGYALLSLLLLSLFLQPRQVKSLKLSELSSGLLLGLLLYCKITYFVFGMGSVLFATALLPRRWRMLPGIAVGIVLVCIFFASVLHIDPRAYLADVAVAGESQALGMRMQLLLGDAMSGAVDVCLIALCLLIWEWARRQTQRPWSSNELRTLLITIWIFGIALGVESGNAAQRDATQDPLYFAAGLIVIESYRRYYAALAPLNHTTLRAAYIVSLMIILALAAFPILFRDVSSFAYSVRWNFFERRSFDPSRRFHSAALQDLRVPASTSHIGSYWPARDHPANINEGIDLLRRHLLPGDSVTTIAFANPFSFALGLQPAHDGPQWWDLHFNFDENHHPTAESFLGAASLVMVPRKVDPHAGGFDTVEVMLHLYGGYLAAHFRPLDSSDHWLLYRRIS